MDKAKKKRIKRYLTWLAMAALVALLTVMPLLAKNEAEEDGPVASILSAQAEEAVIQEALHGGGTLKEQGAQNVKIPADVKITKFLVKNGDYVKEGDPVALVDKVSVMTAITQVDETLQFLRQKIESARNEKVDASITAVAGGRVKKIFAKEGESVQEVMLRDGALAVLSIDGMMAVKIENDVPLTTGEAVTLRFPDQTEATGRVESSLDGVKVITVEDEGYPVGQTVLVTTLDGEAVGSGTLYIHNAWKATGHTGIISRVQAKEESELYSGSVLFTLEDRDYTAQLQHRANQHREYEDLLQRLLKMYESGTICAPCEGVISGVDSDSPHLLSEEEESWTADPLASTQTGTGYKIILLANTTADAGACTETKECEAKAGEHKEKCPMECTKREGCPAKNHYGDCITHCDKADKPEDCDATAAHYKDCIKSCTKQEKCDSGKHYEDCLSLCISAATEGACPGKAHKSSCIESCTKESTSGVCQADQHHHKPDCIDSCILSKSEANPCPGNKHKDGCYYEDVVYYGYAVKVDYYSPVDGRMGILAKTEKFTATSMSDLKNQILAAIGSMAATKGEIQVGTGQNYSHNAVVMFAEGYKGTKPVESKMETLRPGDGTGGTSGFPGLNFNFNIDLSGMLGGFAGYGNYGYTTQPQDEGLYDLDGSTLLTVTPVGVMTLEIALDEHDISKVQEGMPAEVQLAAIRGKTYPAWITEIGIQGTNNGGSSKFIVELTMDSTMDMLSGMSATAQIPLETYENVLTIPAAALTEDGAKTVVYTALGEDTGEPASPREVQTGVSDGQRVEILSGLTAGETVYYSYYDTLELDTSAEAERFTFG